MHRELDEYSVDEYITNVEIVEEEEAEEPVTRERSPRALAIRSTVSGILLSRTRLEEIADSLRRSELALKSAKKVASAAGEAFSNEADIVCACRDQIEQTLRR